MHGCQHSYRRSFLIDFSITQHAQVVPYQSVLSPVQRWPESVATLGRVGQDLAGARMPGFELARRIHVILKEEVVDRVTLPARASRPVRDRPPLYTLEMSPRALAPRSGRQDVLVSSVTLAPVRPSPLTRARRVSDRRPTAQSRDPRRRAPSSGTGLRRPSSRVPGSPSGSDRRTVACGSSGPGDWRGSRGRAPRRDRTAG